MPEFISLFFIFYHSSLWLSWIGAFPRYNVHFLEPLAHLVYVSVSSHATRGATTTPPLDRDQCALDSPSLPMRNHPFLYLAKIPKEILSAALRIQVVPDGSLP